MPPSTNAGAPLPERGGTETPYEREAGYALRYRDARFATGSGPRTHAREVAAIAALLRQAAAECGAVVEVGAGTWLDLPAGAGRLTHVLPGAAVVRVDRDLEMLRACGVTHPRACATAHRLPFRDGAFAGALCMRLLQHVPGGDERTHILAELRRVTRGPLVVSFFHAASLQHLRRRLRRAFGKRRSGRSAVTWGRFRRELAAAGWRAVATAPLWRFVSDQWLVLAVPAAPAASPPAGGAPSPPEP